MARLHCSSLSHILVFVCSSCSYGLYMLPSPRIDPLSTGERLPLPIEWVHIPKTGTSFLHTLFRVPGACENLPSEVTSADLSSLIWNMSFQRFSCNASVLDISHERLWHIGIDYKPDGGFQAAKGRFVTFLRQPEDLMLSHYYYDVGESNWNRSLPAYLDVFSGCVTKMLTSSSPDYACRQSAPTPFQVEEAKHRLKTGFFFIGMTEQWNLSICLFNTMFNQKCHPAQFENTRPTKGTNTPYDVSVLKGWRDPYDHEVYNVGVEIFNMNLKKYNVSESSCIPCWQAAGVF